MLHLNVAEVAPAGPVLVELGALAGLLVAAGLCYVAIYFCRALFGTAGSIVGWIPWIGKATQGALSSIEQKLTSELGKAAAGLDNKCAHMWHRIAGTTRWLAHEIAANAGALLNIATMIATPLSIPAWKALYNDLLKVAHAAKVAIKPITTTVVKPVQHTVTKVVKVTTTRIEVASKALAQVIAHDIPAIRHRARVAEDDAIKALRKANRLEKALAGLAVTGVIAAALARLGVGWTRCANFRNNQKQLCAIDPSLFESLLADTLLIFGTLSLVEFAKEMEGVTEAAVRPIAEFWRAG